jgi:prepilin-type processing-associated H-X9-DG protein
MQELLLGYLLGALDPHEHREVEQQLSEDPLLRYQLEEARAQLATLEAGRGSYEPPLALAARTCEMVAARPMVAASDMQAVGNASTSRMRMIDMAVAASVMLAAAALFMPALSNSRYAAQLAQCQNNLRNIGRSLMQFGQAHNGQLPKVPERGKLAAAGVDAPRLVETGHREVSDWVVGPASDLAERRSDWSMPSISDLQAASGEQLVAMHQTMGGSYGYSLGYVDIDSQKYHGPSSGESAATYALMADSPASDPTGRRGCNHLKCGQNVLYADGHVTYLVDCHGEGCHDNIYLNEQGMVAAGRHQRDAVIGHSSAAPNPLQAFEPAAEAGK